MDKINTEIFSMRMPSGLLDKFRSQCEANYQTMSEAIRELIRKYIKEETMNKKVKIETIHAVDDLNGKYVLSVWQDLIEATTTSGTEWVTGLKSVCDQNGNNVNVLDYDKGEFLVVATNTKLKRI